MTTYTDYALTSLTAVKRALTMGAGLELLASEAPHLANDVGRVRRVEVVQGNAIAWRGVWGNGGREWRPDTLGWLYWPRASEVTPHGDATFTIDFGRWSATYRVHAPESEEA